MTALLSQIIEPPGNLVRLGRERASQLQRKAEAQVLYVHGSGGRKDTIDPNVPAIPWTSGFGSSDPPPTDAGTIDLVNYTRYVTFTIAHTVDSDHVPMYVARLDDWDALAGDNSRVLVPLDIYELRTSHYAGREMVLPFLNAQSGLYDTGGGVPVGASTSGPEYGDYGYADIPYGTDYPAGVVPNVVPVSCDRDFVATVDMAHTTNHSVRVYVRRVRSLTAPVYGSEDVHIDGSGTPTAHGELTGVDYNGVTFDSAPLVFPSVTADPSGGEFEADYQPSVKDVGTSTFTLRLDHLSPTIDPFPTGTGSGATDYATTDISLSGGAGTTGNESAHTHHIPAGTDTLGGTTDAPVAPHNHGTPGHGHVVAEPHSGDGHTHDPGSLQFHTSIFTDEVTDRVLIVAWMAAGQQHADATHVPVSWTAMG